MKNWLICYHSISLPGPICYQGILNRTLGSNSRSKVLNDRRSLVRTDTPKRSLFFLFIDVFSVVGILLHDPSNYKHSIWVLFSAILLKFYTTTANGS